MGFRDGLAGNVTALMMTGTSNCKRKYPSGGAPHSGLDFPCMEEWPAVETSADSWAERMARLVAESKQAGNICSNEEKCMHADFRSQGNASKGLQCS